VIPSPALKPEIIAEVAQGFEGQPEQSAILLKAAASANADGVKFQVVYADELATPGYKYYDLFRSLEMTDDTWKMLADRAAALGIGLHLDVFGARSLALAADIGVTSIKLHGTDTANIGFLRQVAESSIARVILGAGGARLAEIESALAILRTKNIVLMLGFQGYPTPNDGNQISRVSLLCQRYAGRPNVTLGFADHACPDSPLRYALAAGAVGAGAQVIEKHLTLGKVMKLEDHESALNPDEFSEFCTTIRAVGTAIGTTTESDDFGMSESERSYRTMIRRHVIATRDLVAGTKIGPEDVELKRSGSSAPLTEIDATYGRSLKRAVTRGEALEHEDLD